MLRKQKGGHISANKHTGGYTATRMTDKQIKAAVKSNITIKNNELLTIYKKKGYALDDRKKLFSNYIENKTKKQNIASRKKPNIKYNYEMKLPNINLDDIINKINGGCDRLDYY